MSFTVQSLVPGITQKLGNRGDLLTVDSNGQTAMYLWIKAAVLEITDDYQFEELVITGNVMQFTTNTFQYTKNYFTVNNEDWTDIRSWFMWVNPGLAPTSGSVSTTGINVGWNLEGRAEMVVKPLAQIPALPKFWAQVGDKVIVGMCPNNSYYTQWIYQRKHPFTAVVAAADTIYMPDSWKEVIEVSAALRGAIDKRAADFITLYDNILNGGTVTDSDGHKIKKPGMIMGLVAQQQRNKTHNSRQLAPTVSRYGAR